MRNKVSALGIGSTRMTIKFDNKFEANPADKGIVVSSVAEANLFLPFHAVRVLRNVQRKTHRTMPGYAFIVTRYYARS
jgi:hypothetical protein